jgi:hypothetical protein
MTTIIATTLIFFLQAGTGTGSRVAQSMTTGGWVFMLGAWACILTLVIYTFSKVLGGGRK